MDEQKRKEISEQLLKIIKECKADSDEWVNFTDIGEAVAASELQYKELGFSKLKPFLNEFEDVLEFREEQPEGKLPVFYARPKRKRSAIEIAEAKFAAIKAKLSELTGSIIADTDNSTVNDDKPEAVVEKTGSQKRTMSEAERLSISEKLLDIVKSYQTDDTSWVNLVKVGMSVTKSGINFKELGFAKLKAFLGEFSDVFEFMEEYPEGKLPISYVRPRIESDDHAFAEENKVEADVSVSKNKDEKPESVEPEPEEKPVSSGISYYHANRAPVYSVERVPNKDSWLFKWASISNESIRRLAELALEEPWYYGEPPREDQEQYPLLKNYLAYTFKRLTSEGKVRFENDLERNEEYAAFNTGLVDKKYECIYALFKKNTKYDGGYWYLLAFVVAGEDIGKTLTSLFNPLPERANYFDNKIENMLYDTSTGDLSCDYTHILNERTDRLPLDFLEENCSKSFLCIDGVSIRDMYYKSHSDRERKAYFAALGNKISADTRILKRLKNRVEDAVDLALKRVEWNYKTAIPMYFPTENKGSLLLPLALVDENRIDLALVVERQPSGAYQGQTVLPLNLAYCNSRLVARPDSDWLRMDVIATAASDDSNDIDDDK